jgi:hypothetical protein
MTDKLIFLDIDEVLSNHALGTTDPAIRKRFNDIDTPGGRLSSINIANLNSITDQTEAKIVISSSWRILYDLPELCDILYDAGVTGEIIGLTPILGANTLRGNEIYKYIKDNYSYDFEPNYVILDDGTDMLYWQRNNFFWCDPFCGLSPGIAYKAARFLNGVN